MEGILMKLKLQLLLAGAALGVLAGCAAGGGGAVSLAGASDSKGCRTIYVFRPAIGEGASPLLDTL